MPCGGVLSGPLVEKKRRQRRNGPASVTQHTGGHVFQHVFNKTTSRFTSTSTTTTRTNDDQNTRGDRRSRKATKQLSSTHAARSTGSRKAKKSCCCARRRMISLPRRQRHGARTKRTYTAAVRTAAELHTYVHTYDHMIHACNTRGTVVARNKHDACTRRFGPSRVETQNAGRAQQ